MPGTDRRHSTSSEDANAPPPPIRQMSQDGTEIIPTRMSKVTTPKPASNPLQFIKTGPCDLYKAAQEQIKRVEEIKKVEKVKDDSEDWQSNLDNWKCSRRKRQEHIIERVVEAKKLELEELDRNRRRSKTFNEMIEERSSKGGLRKMSILSYSEDDGNDFTDLGISSNNKEKSSGDFSNENQVQNGSKVNNDGDDVSSSNGHGSNYDGGSSTPATISSPEPEEYTYERAIQGYMNFAEAKIKTPIKGKTDEGKGVNGNANVRIGAMKKEPSGKIGEKLSELEQIRLRSKSASDINGGSGVEAKQLPKVDIHKRRSMFENVESTDPCQVKSADRLPKDISNSKIVKERLTSLEKSGEESVTKVNRLSAEVSPHIKETISNLEKQKSVEGSSSNSGKRLSNGDISPQISIKERLNSLEKQQDGPGKPRTPVEEITPISIKERMSSFDAGNQNREPAVKLTPERDATFKEKLETFKSTEKSQNEVVNSTGSNNCSDSKPNVRSCLDRLETEDEKPEVKATSEEVTISKSEITEEPVSQPKVEETVSVPKKPETIEDSVPVSSDDKETVNNLVVVAVDGLEGSGDGAEPKSEPKDDEVPEVRPESEGMELKSNKEVEGDEVPVPEEGNQLTSVRTDIRYDSQLTSAGCDVSKTVVTEISLPDAQVPCSRVNISVSVGEKEERDPEEDEEALDEFPDEVHPTGFRDSLYSNKPKTRVRKLTPILSTPVAPLKTVCELQIIEEGESADPEDDSERRVKEGGESCRSGKYIAVHMTPQPFAPEFYKSNNEVQEFMGKTSPEDMDEEQQEESSVYTDENIDEVLDKDDEVETCVDEETRFDGISEESKIQKELEIFTPKDATDVLTSVPNLKADVTEKTGPTSANYENVFITNQVPQLNMSSDSDIYATLTFPLGSRPSIEPPKEKPPPPPLELSDDESAKPELPPKPSLRRLDSTKRIKKEIRKKRSDFLGIEGNNDDSYLEPEIYVAPPPDMMAFLQEERRLEQQLYRQSICSESDSNHETAESRDSGVELDRGHVDDICWSKPDVLSESHSRQNSETYGNTSMTSEEDEILKKEREIIEVLEKEEQWRYKCGTHTAEQNNIGEKLAVKLRQLEQEKMQLERERAEEEGRRKAEESARRQNEQRLIAKQQQLREQENSNSHSNMDPALEQEALRFERERLQKEQEHLERCRQNLLKQQQQSSEPIEIHHRGSITHWDTPSNRHSLQEVPIGVPMQDVPRHSMQDVSQPQYQSQMSSGYRYSLPDLQQRDPRSPRPPPPIPPAKPVRPMTQEQWERETNIRNSRIPSADNIPLQIEASSKLRHGSSVPAININHGGQQMTRSTLHALSAAPRSRIISNENWMQPKRKVDAPKTNYNYQHWLIQEAEHRRIIEHQQKVSQQLQPKPRSHGYNGQPPTNYPCSPPSHHTVGLPISPPAVQGQQSNQKWMSPPRADKPLPDSVIHTLTQRVQSRESKTPSRRRPDNPNPPLSNKMSPPGPEAHSQMNTSGQTQERMLSVSGKKKCSHCSEELGRGAAMIIESLRLFYHIDCFKCCVCHVQLGDGLMGTDVRVRNNKLHCHNCYSSDDENGDDAQVNSVPVDVIPEEIDDSLSPVTLDAVTDDSDLSSCQLWDPFPSDGMSEDVPDWFKQFYAAYRRNENRKYVLMQETALQMIDFEIRKCELLTDIIQRLKD